MLMIFGAALTLTGILLFVLFFLDERGYSEMLSQFEFGPGREPLLKHPLWSLQLSSRGIATSTLITLIGVALMYGHFALLQLR